MSTIQVRIDTTVKKKAQNILHEMGLDLSSAINAYLRQIIIQEAIPFRIVTENGFTPEEEMEILKAEKEALEGKNVTKSMNIKEAIEYLNKL